MMTWNDLARVFLRGLSDQQFCTLQYLFKQGRWPHWENPSTFNEQIQWLKVFYKDPLLKICADKYTVRDYVRQTIGESHLIPLISVFDNPNNIPFENLPARFALKASHGSGWNILCREKRSLDVPATKKKLTRWMHSNFYPIGREWAYDGLTPRIVCEEFLAGSEGEPPWDYKFFCFYGIPRYVQVDYARFTHHTRAIYDTKWQRVPCRLEYRLQENDSAPPSTLGKMLEIASALSAPFPLVRVDLYELAGCVFFGELTFYPGKGVERFSPREFDKIFGQWFDLARAQKSIQAGYPRDSISTWPRHPGGGRK